MSTTQVAMKTISNRYHIKILLISYFVYCPLLADDNEEQLLNTLLGSTYASIATGYGQQLADAPGLVNVITAQDIQRMGATSLEQVLATVPGIHVTTARGFRTVYASRGITSENNSDFLIKIDDVPVRDLALGGRPIVYSMLVRNISRIEIVRGPGSVVHGSDAIGGIMNIITKTGKELITDPANGSGGEATLYGGSFSTYGGALLYGGHTEDFEYALSFQAETTNGNNRRVKRDAQTILDEQFLTSASNAPGRINQDKTQTHFHLDLGYKQKLKFRLGFRKFIDFGSGIGTGGSLVPKESLNNEWANFDIDYHGKIGSSIDTETNFIYQFSTQDAELHALPVGSSLIPNGMTQIIDYTNQQVIGKTKATITSFEAHKIQIGTGLIMNFLTNLRHKQNFILTETPLSPSPIPVSLPGLVQTKTLFEDPFTKRRRRFQFFAMIQDEWMLYPDWNLTTGLRIDKYTDETNPVFSPRVALVHHFSPLLTGKLLYNRSFHVPSFLEQAFGDNLDPEIIDMVELAVEGKDLQANAYSATWFWYNLDNLIVENSTNFNFAKFSNVDIQGTGVEVSTLRHFTDTLSAKFSYSFSWVVEKKSGDVYGLAPNHMIFSEMNWEFFPTWHLNTQIKWISERKRRKTDPRKHLDGYTNASINLFKEFHYAQFRYLRLNFKINNLFNVDAREPSNSGIVPGDIPLPGRSFMGIVEASF
jgi:iron complex outermembrane receptor protein